MSTTQLVAAPALTADEARTIGVDAYIYFYPLILMDLTRKQSINTLMPEFGKGPMNMFVKSAAYPPAEFKGVVRSNFDTLYSMARELDLTRGTAGCFSTGYQRTVLSAADAGYVDGCLCVSGLAHDRHRGGGFSGDPAGLERNYSCLVNADLRADSVCVGDWPHEDGWTGGLRRGA